MIKLGEKSGSLESSQELPASGLVDPCQVADPNPGPLSGESKGIQHNKESKDIQYSKDTNKTKATQYNKVIKDTKQPKDIKQIRDIKDSKDIKYIRDIKDDKDDTATIHTQTPHSYITRETIHLKTILNTKTNKQLSTLN
ncbi:hypothetical protein PENSTE_c004G03689 [Penicillium steckii]|uniref:Uncharacterized protein n=1 Tax=Penicillium steckii TaxID=303698 RepID=A0A1V6TNW8_9EURO|nr:hypothetical protein PENSTE_c004G03689 [Penicillium steckii]